MMEVVGARPAMSSRQASATELRTRSTPGRTGPLGRQRRVRDPAADTISDIPTTPTHGSGAPFPLSSGLERSADRPSPPNGVQRAQDIASRLLIVGAAFP